MAANFPDRQSMNVWLVLSIVGAVLALVAWGSLFFPPMQRIWLRFW